LIGTLRDCSAPELGAEVLGRIGSFTPAAREAALDLLLSRPALTTDLLDALETGEIRVSDLSLTQKQRLHDFPRRRVRARARALFAQSQGAVSADRKQVVEQFDDLLDAKGDPANGKLVFTKNCAVCHRYLGEGGLVGPDITGMAVHGKQQLLVHLLDPNRDVEGNYQAYVLVTTDGRILNGLLAGESATSVDLIDNEGKRRAILREDIDEITRTGKSLMPDGFEKQLSKNELADLLEFLTERSQFVPLDMHRVATISSAGGMFQTPGSDGPGLVFDDWGVKMFNGVPFYPIDPQGGRMRNIIMLHSDRGSIAPKMPKSVELPCGIAAKAIHFLSGVSGWGYPASEAGTTSMVVRLHYGGGESEDHPLVNGVHFADYERHTDIAGSQLAFNLGRHQVRYIRIAPKRGEPIKSIELVKGADTTAPIVMSVTVEQR
jgi:putative heme-binding domain-containing protein